jgi:hypothetical protein
MRGAQGKEGDRVSFEVGPDSRSGKPQAVGVKVLI